MLYYNYNFTKREQQIFNLLMLGKSKEDIALFLNMKASTLHTHLMNIFKKADVHSMTELLLKLLQNINATAKHIIKLEASNRAFENRCKSLELSNNKLRKNLSEIQDKVAEFKRSIAEQ